MKSQPSLTAPEIANLWISYQNDSLSYYMISYLAKHVEDLEIRDVLKYAIRLSKEHVSKVAYFYENEGHTKPIGFTESDVDVDAPRLFSDLYCLFYIIDMAKFALPAYGLALSVATRPDVMAYYNDCLNETQVLFTRATKLAIRKGLLILPPSIPVPNKIDFVTKQSFLNGWFDKRPLLGIEISDLIYNTKRNALALATVTGFAQTAESEEVRKYFERGKKISKKQLNVFTSILSDNDLLPATQNFTTEVTTSTTPPFSDKLMMYHATTFIASSTAQFGFAMSSSPRRDLGLMYARLMAEIALFAEDGANIMIDKNWMEQPPIAPNRDKLIKK